MFLLNLNLIKKNSNNFQKLSQNKTVSTVEISPNSSDSDGISGNSNIKNNIYIKQLLTDKEAMTP